jgi:hypothetical protein
MAIQSDLVLSPVAWSLALSLTCMSCFEARAENNTYLACAGAVHVVRAGVWSTEEPWTFSLTVDAEKKTITVDDYDPVPFSGEASENTIVFMPSRPTHFGVSTGTLHRITGQARVHIINDGLHIITGICRPARKLF